MEEAEAGRSGRYCEEEDDCMFRDERRKQDGKGGKGESFVNPFQTLHDPNSPQSMIRQDIAESATARQRQLFTGSSSQEEIGNLMDKVAKAKAMADDKRSTVFNPEWVSKRTKAQEEEQKIAEEQAERRIEVEQTNADDASERRTHPFDM